MANKAYSVLSKIYDKAMEGIQAEWAEHVISLLKDNVTGNSGLDVACGSGYFTRAIKRSGYDVKGVDVSPEMLTVAEELSSEERLKIEYINCDMARLKVFSKVDFITVINDGINYLDGKRLSAAFKAFYAALNKNGVLIFDFSSEYKLKNIIANNLFGEDYDDFTYLWFNKLYDDRIEMDLTIFTRAGDFYKKEEESHIQYIHSIDFILQSLKSAGFVNIAVNGSSDGHFDKQAQKYEVVAKK